jgi:hypothetical protein
MEELREQLDTILEEAIGKNFDQLLVVSRSDESHLYMLSKGRVKKRIVFEQDIAGAFVKYFTTKAIPEELQDQLRCEMNVTAAAGLGKCYSVKFQKKTE